MPPSATKDRHHDRKKKPAATRSGLEDSNPRPEALRAAILGELEDIARLGHDRRRIVTDWVELMFWALQRNDPEYLAVLDHYDIAPDHKRRAAAHFRDAFHLLLAYMQRTNRETLGDIWMEFCANEALGQFFTPPNISTMMAKILGTTPPAEGDFQILDPCCGAGGMLVAYLKEMTCAEADRCLFVAQDIDRTCCMMTALNLCFFNADSVIIWGNSLDIGDVRGAWTTKRSYVWGGSIHPYPTDKAREMILNSWERSLTDRAAEPGKATAGNGLEIRPAPAMVQLKLF